MVQHVKQILPKSYKNYTNVLALDDKMKYNALAATLTLVQV